MGKKFSEKVKDTAYNEKGKARRLYRSGKEKILGGVCGGIAEYFNVDPVLIRIIWVAFALAGGSGILAYLIAWIIIPRNPKHEWNS
ncbi:PspC domain-containing protein [Candidatus Micrarchaeota archaeon]|nr:PspC domain-containing protein [Candidatus Micrarchaeota archaeon]MBU2476203.1 PspC domain-containing protein [Candidatus Micrarchaeota archaeon]